MLKRVTLDRHDKGRIVIIGDIHGCLEQFNNLLNKIKFHQDYDKLVLVGDLVNKGPDSIGVVRRAINLDAHCVMGNHDAALLTAIQRLRDKEIDAKSPEFIDDPLVQLAAKFPDNCYKYLRNLPHVIEIVQYGVTVVHAGFNPTKTLEEQNVWDMMHMRRVTNDGRALDSGSHGQLWAKRWRGFPGGNNTSGSSPPSLSSSVFSSPTGANSSNKDQPSHVVFGHDARSGLQHEKHATGLDSGCCYGGELAAMVLPSRSIVTVPGYKGQVQRRPKNQDKGKISGATNPNEQKNSPVSRGGNDDNVSPMIAPIQSQPFLTPMEGISNQGMSAKFPSDVMDFFKPKEHEKGAATRGSHTVPTLPKQHDNQGVSPVLTKLLNNFPDKQQRGGGAAKSLSTSSSPADGEKNGTTKNGHKTVTKKKQRKPLDPSAMLYQHLFRMAVMLAPRSETAAAALALLNGNQDGSSDNTSPLSDSEFREMVVCDKKVLPTGLCADLVDALITGLPHNLHISPETSSIADKNEENALRLSDEALSWVQDIALERPETLEHLSKSSNSNSEKASQKNSPSVSNGKKTGAKSPSASSVSGGSDADGSDRRRRLIDTLQTCAQSNVVKSNKSTARAIKATILALR